MKNLKRALSFVLCFIIALSLVPATALAVEDTREVISEVNITMPGIENMPVDGALTTDPAYTIDLSYIGADYTNWWYTENGSSWKVAGSRFEEGTYRYHFGLDISTTQAEHYKFADNLVVKVNGVPCGFLEKGNPSGSTITSGYVTDNGTSVLVCTPEYTAVPGPLVFVDDPALDIPEHVAGTVMYTGRSFEVYGGTKPYTFTKVSGPDWITLAADGGTTGGVPTVVGSNSDLVVRVTDSSSPAQSQEITIRVGDTKAGVGAVTIANPISELQKPGSHQYNATVVTYGASDEIIWSISGGTDSTISTNGLLNVGVNETATSLTITATSAIDNTKFDTTVVYIKDYYIVNSVEVAPENTTVNTTKTQQFTAKALNDLGYQIAGEQFIWSVSGGTDSTISADGLLSVGTDETATTLTVTATSVTDPTKSDSVQVTVKQQKFQVILWDKGVLYTEYTVAEGKKVAKPTDPTRTGYTFDGWYQDETFTDIWDFENDTVTGNTDLYAKWTPVGSVTQVNHVALTGAPAKYEIGKTVGDYPLTGLSVSAGEVQLAGGAMWMATNTATPGMYDLSEPLNGSTVFTAFDSSNPRYFVVASAVMAKDGFDLSDSMTATVDGAEAIVLVINAGGVKGAYILLPYDPATGNRPDASAPTTYTVAFDSDGGTAVTAQTVESGKTATKPADPTKTGYTFKGWTLDGAAYDFTTPVTGNITLKAKWEAAAPIKYAIEVTLNGYSLGAKVADAYVSESSDTVDFYDFNADGTFFCIFEDDGTGQSDWGSTVTQFEADKDYWLVVALAKQGGDALPEAELDADNATLVNGCVDKLTVYDDDLWWVEFKLSRLSSALPDVYTITFDAAGGSVTPGSATTGNDGKLTSLPTPTHTNPYAVFDGWYTGKTGDIKVTTDTVFTSDTTVYAHWNVDYAIEVTLNGYELGKKVADTTLTENSDTLDIDRENCHIFTDKAGEPDWSSTVTEFEAGKDYWLVIALTKQGGDALTSADLGADDVDLTNDYTKEQLVYDDDLWWVSYKLKRLDTSDPTTYTVTFDSDGGSTVAAQTVNAGGKATKPADPTKEGYTFKGWTLNGTAYDFNTAVTGNITLKATWEAKQATPPAGDNNQGTNKPADTPQTGDSMNLVLWSTLAMVSALAVVVLIVFKKKRYPVK